jgi:sulfopropanediol 3-dehydrogenase
MRYLKEPLSPTEAVTLEIQDTVSQILSNVEMEGTTSIRRHSERFDGWAPESFRVSESEIQRAHDEMGGTVQESS